eukprot:TRINITY_DN55389_c0_g1_i1.p2 TRINITY_DN55389_c0_g1~~TRINITY_DN55389_c0_g1_i1.p2  ORF type:complete len:121 (-),score=19.67 TRINITY_DN55389_c0_g1_i1:229-591(-)
MSFASCARWARCRNAHCSTWARNINVQMRMNRGLAAAPILRLVAEPMPLGGFPEQRSTVSCSSRLCLGEAVDDVTGAASAQAIAGILNSLAEMDAAISNSFTEMLDLSVLGHIDSGLLSE